jgi:GH25 family lysozyme M1 (1,4-beta-N-acetylmuramidase)
VARWDTRWHLRDRVSRVPAAIVVALMVIVAAGGVAYAAGTGRSTTRAPRHHAAVPGAHPSATPRALPPAASPAQPTETASGLTSGLVTTGGAGGSSPASTSGTTLSTERTAPLLPVSHPQADRLGSTICAHEQCDPPAAPPLAAALSAPAAATTTKPSAPAAKVTPKPTTALPTTALPTTALPTPKPVTAKPVTPPATAKPVTPPVVIPPAPSQPGPVRGLDVSSYQGNVDWAGTYSRGGRFVYAKATEGTGYRNPYFSQQYSGSRAAGLVRGAYHFALPDRSSGVVQADYFIAHGGGWSPDSWTLPPMLDIEYDPYGPQICYGLSASQMSRWIADFSNEVHARSGRYPTIYTTRNWWNTCTGSNSSFGANNPLFLACYCSSPGAMPAGWGRQTIWQYNSSGSLPGDQDLFNGAYANLRRFTLP